MVTPNLDDESTYVTFEDGTKWLQNGWDRRPNPVMYPMVNNKNPTLNWLVPMRKNPTIMFHGMKQ